MGIHNRCISPQTVHRRVPVTECAPEEHTKKHSDRKPLSELSSKTNNHLGWKGNSGVKFYLSTKANSTCLFLMVISIFTHFGMKGLPTDCVLDNDRWGGVLTRRLCCALYSAARILQHKITVILSYTN